MRLQRRQTPPGAGLWAGGLLAAAFAAAAVWLRLGLPTPPCTFRNLTGLPCATCGSTRMVRALVSGEILDAFRWNPLVFALVTGLAVWGLWSLARLVFHLQGWWLSWSAGERRVLIVLAIAVVLANWAFQIATT